MHKHIYKKKTNTDDDYYKTFYRKKMHHLYNFNSKYYLYSGLFSLVYYTKTHIYDIFKV